jgi:hypothetical protein
MKALRNRSLRRAQQKKAEARSLRRIKEVERRNSESVTQKAIHLYTSTHGKPCSCWMCGNPRKFFKQATLQEVRHNNAQVEQERLLENEEA